MAGLNPGNSNTNGGGATSVPPSPGLSIHGGRPGFIPLVTVVDFHHARGPEVEKWFGVPEGTDPAEEWKWPLLPFMALSDGAHASTEDFSYFTLLRPATDDLPPTSLFGISCTRQLDASQLLVRPADVTRSTVQKAVVVIADSPQYFGMLRERLSVVTSAWFAQREFSDCEILRRFQESLKEEKERGQFSEEVDRDQYLGMNLRELVHEFRWQTLVLLKCCLLQPKMLFFGARCERLCMMQFSLISLIPGLLRSLQDCAGPELDSYEKRLSKPTSLKTSDRNSLLAYMGLPLQIFGKGSLLGPYTPLQQLDILADKGTKSYIVGSTNSLLLQQRDRYSDILINLDDSTINITSTSLRAALALTASDRRWIDFITQEVNDTWDERNPAQPNHMGYRGSEEFIRLQFEEYLLSLISSVKYHNYLAQHPNDPKMALPEIDGDPAADYGYEWVEYWSRTDNYRMWNAHTDSLIFDIVVPKHPCAGGLTMDDVQRRIQQQVQDMHLDERFAAGREVLGRNAAAAREKASTMFNKFYADMETMREAQRKRAEETKAAAETTEQNEIGSAPNGDASKAAAPAASGVGAKAGAYIGSWASWAGEKRKQGWGGRPTSGMSTASAGAGGGGGWGFGVRKWTKSDSASERNVTPLNSPGLTSPKFMSGEKGWMGIRASTDGSEMSEFERPGTQHSFGESVLDAAGSESGSSSPVSQRKTERSPSGASVASKGGNLEGIDELVAKDMASITAAAKEAPKGEASHSDASREEPNKTASPAKEEPKPETLPAKETQEVPAKEEKPKASGNKEKVGEEVQKAEQKPDASQKTPEAPTKEDLKSEAIPSEDESDKEASPAKGELEEDSAAATDAWKTESPSVRDEPKKDGNTW